ncbi:unnamed protein product [Orchesella dallaii]|uniref:SAM domain-containing protein n=1 Tax=Orchesella dallaii TaxID=48710 RepID=A0ABP1PSM5_9HEXA
MNKPRPSALPLKKAIRVSPPTAPGFFSFHSFRAKKGQSRGDCSEPLPRRRTSSGDCEHSSSPWASAVSPLPTQKTLLSGTDNGRVSTFRTFTAESAPCSPCAGPELRNLKGSANLHPLDKVNLIETFDSVPTNLEFEHGCGPNYSVGAISEMHKGYYDKNGTNHSVNDTNDFHGKPPTGVVRHQTLRSNSEPHGHSYYGGGTELGVGPNHVLSNVYGNHIVLEDQGIDMSQSPGHESPSSTVSSNTVSVSGGSGVSSGGSGSTGCRHSAASFDSGRASSSLYQQGVRYSGLSSESSSTGSCRHSYHSSSSSLGSIPPEEICNFDVSSMIAQGLPDTEILNAWLTGVHFECYYQNFIQAGYDMQTIVKMTPEDLNAIGITKPNHRKRLKSEISQLIIPDGLLDYIPSTIEEWLRALRMEEYTEKLKAQGYTNVRQVTNITWEDLEDIGILKLGHQKKFLLAIKRIEDILSGKRLHTTGAQNAYHHAIDCYAIPHRLPQTSNASQMPYSQHVSSGHNNPTQAPQVHGPPRAYINSFQKGFTNQQSAPPFTWRQHSVGKEEHYGYNESLYSSGDKPNLQLLTHQPQIHQQEKPVSNGISQPEYHPEVIAIHVKNDRRPSAIAEHCGEPIYGTSSFQAPSQPTGGRNYVNTTNKWLEDGETTPTNEVEARVGNSYAEPASTSTALANSTLPRLMKNKALGKAAALAAAEAGQETKATPSDPSGLDITYRDQCTASSAQWQQHQSMDGYKSLPKNMGRFQSTFGNPKNAVGTRQPPPPPRRSTSTTQDRQETFSTFYPASANTGGTLKPQQSWSNKSISDDNDLPAPPPPEDLALMSGSSDKTVPTPASHSMNNSTSSSTSLTNSSGNNPASTTNLSDYHHLHHHNAYASNSSTNAVAYSSNSRIHPSTSGSGRLRDPSPGASDSELTATFATVGVRRNGSDASFKSSSSTESESIPFANDNAGTIKQQKAGNRVPAPGTLDSLYAPNGASGSSGEHIEAGDVLSDIGNMLADLTDELDAILQQEMNSLNKR